MEEKIITFRIDEKTKKEFEKIAKEQDLTTSQMLRHFMRDVVESYSEKKRGK